MGRQQRYDRIETVEKAMNLFWKNGFSATSMRGLEDCLDMRPGSIYANFGNKEKLYLEALEYYAAKSYDELQAQIDNAETFIEGLDHFIRKILFSNDNPCTCMLSKTLADLSPKNAVLREKAAHMVSQFQNSLVATLEAAKAANEIHKDCDTISLAHFIQIQIIGLRSYTEVQKSPDILNSLLDDAIQAIKGKAANQS